MLSLANSIAKIEKENFIHNDLKPANMFII